MRIVLYVFITAVLTVALTIGSYIFFDSYQQFRPIVQKVEDIKASVKEKPLEKYTILNVAKRPVPDVQIVFDEAVATTSSFTKYTFHYTTDGKKVSGLATLPVGIHSVFPSNTSDTSPTSISSKPFPVIIQFRGYVNPAKYFPGEGTQRSAEIFAQRGFISLAPDFLGYGTSDPGATNGFENRFQTYTTAIDCIAGVSSLPFADPTRIGIWGHSNGGHIAITVSEILNKPIPMTLWAPVTKYFPYSILYYMDEADDGGKALRKSLAGFEDDYNVSEFTLTNYLDRLTGPIQFHQGTADDAVPKVWSDEFVDKVKTAGGTITYYVYPGADHNMQGSWNTVVERDTDFFTKSLPSLPH